MRIATWLLVLALPGVAAAQSSREESALGGVRSAMDETAKKKEGKPKQPPDQNGTVTLKPKAQPKQVSDKGVVDLSPKQVSDKGVIQIPAQKKQSGATVLQFETPAQGPAADVLQFELGPDSKKSDGKKPASGTSTAGRPPSGAGTRPGSNPVAEAVARDAMAEGRKDTDTTTATERALLEIRVAIANGRLSRAREIVEGLIREQQERKRELENRIRRYAQVAGGR